MKLKISLFFIWVLAISNLFYQELCGLNTSIVSALSVFTVGFFYRPNLKSPKWWFSAVCWIIASVGIFVNGTVFPIFLYIVSFLYFFAVSNRLQLSLVLGGMQSLQSWCTGFYYSITAFISSFKKMSNERGSKLMANSIIIAACLIIVIIFLKLYQAADPTFYDWTKFINLDWISWGFIFFYLFMLIFLYGFFFFKNELSINQWEDSKKNDIPITYSDKIQKFLGYKNELKAAISLLSILNLLLLLYNIIDVRYVLFEMGSSERVLTDSLMVHDGINSLIGSIILVILLITFMFRGKLNFLKNRILQSLAFIWLLQNMLMVATSAIKNHEYVFHYGLTYKRIGVFIYLMLAIIGISLTVYKLLKNKSIWFLIRSASLSFLFVLVVLVTFNWNRIIASYNLSQITHSEIDFRYLMTLGPDTYPFILDYNAEYGIEDKSIIYDLSGLVPMTIESLELKKKNHSWRSLVWSDMELLEQLKRHRFTYNKMVARWKKY